MTRDLRIGIVDSGVAAGAGLSLEAGRRFRPDPDGRVETADGLEDRLGHGTEVARLIQAAAPTARLYHAQVFGPRFTTSPALVAAGLDWLRSQGVDLINMSFGLRAEREVLRAACAVAAAQGVLMIAAAPAQGAACFPAAYPEVLAVTGDARCAPGEVSDLQGVQADFGTWCASPEQGGGVIAGASVAAAHFTGLAAGFLLQHPGVGPATVRAHFRNIALHVGPERHRGRV